MSAETTDEAVSMVGLVKRYGTHEAVDGIDLVIRRGEFFGLLGPNGAGKTTTIGMLCGFIEPTQGHIRIGGMPALPRSNTLKRKLGLVPQELAFYPTLSAHDNLAFFGRIFGLQGQHLQSRINTVLAMARLDQRDREPVTQFSSGMKRRLNIAIGMLHEPEILVLDEPTVGIDAQSRSAILETLQQLNRDGVTVIYSTHYMEEAQRLCGRVAIMDHGRVIATDSPRRLVRSLGDGIIEIEFAGPPVDACVEKLQALGTLRFQREDRSAFSLQAPEPETMLPRLLEVVRGFDVSIRSLRLLEPNLETVFLKLTGRQLRD